MKYSSSSQSQLITYSFVLLIALFILAGCGIKPTYTIRTKDSREYQTRSEPDITDDRYVKFTTVSGQKVLLKQDEVSVISED